MNKISEHFSKLGKRSWEVRKQRLLDADRAQTNKKAKKARRKTTIEEMQKDIIK